MLKLTKKKLFDLANDGKTLWDLYEILQIYNQRDYNEYLREVFGDNHEEYNIFNDQISLNHFKYRVLNNPSTDNITINDLLKMLDEGKSKIDFMRLFDVITTNKLYKEIKKIFEYSDNTESFEAFKRRLIKNTKRIMLQNDNIKSEEEKKIVYLYALDYLTKNLDNEDFNIPSDKEAYILNISYYLNKFGESNILRKLIATYSKNPNISISSITPINIENNRCFTDDIELLINTALYLKRQGKTPVIVTFNNYNYVKCLSYDIYFCSEISDTLEAEIKRKDQKVEDTSLPYVCYDSSYILNLLKNQNIQELLDTKSNKIIFSHILDDLLYSMWLEHLDYDSYFHSLAILILINPTFHFVSSVDCNKSNTHFDKIGFINNVLFLNLKYKNIIIASDDLEIIEYAISNKITILEKND